jgi:hypothetical protein
MTWYRLEVFKPQELHVHRRDILASDDGEAIRRADELYAGFGLGVPPDRYVLYDGDRVVRERVASKR